jgi:hypothetical protein
LAIALAIAAKGDDPAKLVDIAKAAPDSEK